MEEDIYEQLSQIVQSYAPGATSDVPVCFFQSTSETERHTLYRNMRASGTEIWQAVLAHCERVPKSLQQVFVVQVLISILDDVEITRRSLDDSLQKAFEAVQRVEKAKQGATRTGDSEQRRGEHSPARKGLWDRRAA
jgi:hypothetical protein